MYIPHLPGSLSLHILDPLVQAPALLTSAKHMPLPTYKGYTVDYRLKQFRMVHPGDCICGGGDIEFIEFSSEKGDILLSEMLRKGLVPDEIVSTLF